MGKSLTDEESREFKASGIHFPVTAFDADEAQDLLRQYREIEVHDGGRVLPRTNKKPHLLLPWLNDLIRSPRILDAVEDVLGPDILCWSSTFFAKPARDPGYISWHQDATYWGLSTADVLTVWLALTPSTVESGCLRVVPGTHKEQVPHVDKYDKANMLTRGQEIAVDVREEDVVDVVLQPGQFSMHNVLLFHGSNSNRADHDRIGYAIRYIAAGVKQTVAAADSVTLVRGVDKYNNFEHEQRPVAPFDPVAVAHHRMVTDRQAQLVYTGAKEPGRRQAEKDIEERARQAAPTDSTWR